jgi:hypothetical protein
MPARGPHAARDDHYCAYSPGDFMKNFYMGLSLCSVFLLHGCFDNSDNTTKDNTSGSKSSVQMQEGKADDSK